MIKSSNEIAMSWILEAFVFGFDKNQSIYIIKLINYLIYISNVDNYVSKTEIIQKLLSVAYNILNIFDLKKFI